MVLRILTLGDVVGQYGISLLTKNRHLNEMRKRYGAHFVIVNGENASAQNGLKPDDAETLFDAGCDVITGGNHIFRHHSLYTRLDKAKDIIRPANYPAKAPGVGYTIGVANGYRILVANLQGCVFMDQLASPFETADKILKEADGRYDISIFDVHAEATSEKIALARYLDGRVSAVFGTHTHVQTNDASVLAGGTGYVTDIGMCGSMNGVLGVKTECILHRFTVKTPMPFEPAEGGGMIHGAIFDIDTASGKCTNCEVIKEG